jgi:hypothetical protein
VQIVEELFMYRTVKPELAVAAVSVSGESPKVTVPEGALNEIV